VAKIYLLGTACASSSHLEMINIFTVKNFFSQHRCRKHAAHSPQCEKTKKIFAAEAFIRGFTVLSTDAEAFRPSPVSFHPGSAQCNK